MKNMLIGFYNKEDIKRIIRKDDDRTLLKRIKEEGVTLVKMFGEEVISHEDMIKLYESKKSKKTEISSYKAKDDLSKFE